MQFGKQSSRSQTLEHWTTLWPSNSMPRSVPKRNGGISLYKSLYIMFSLSLFKITEYKCPNVSQLMNGQTEISLQCEIIPLWKDTCFNPSKAWRLCAEWKKPVTRGRVLMWLRYCEMSRVDKSAESGGGGGLRRRERTEWVVLHDGVLLRSDKKVWKPVMVMAARICE